MNPPVFLIIGPQGHGKTAVRDIVARLTYSKGASCSDVIYAFLAQRKGVLQSELRLLPKEQIRPELIEAGDFMTGVLPEIETIGGPNAKEIDESIYRRPSILVRTLYLNGYKVIDGVRRKAELEESIDHLEWNGVRSYVLYVHDPRKAASKDNTEDLKEYAGVHIRNGGTLEDLEREVKAWLEKTFGPLDAKPEIPVVNLKTGDIEKLTGEKVELPAAPDA